MGSRVQGIIDKKSTLNVLSHVLITSDENGIRMTSTDYDVVLFCHQEAEVIQAGSMAVNGRSLFDVVKSLRTSKFFSRGWKTIGLKWFVVVLGSD